MNPSGATQFWGYDLREAFLIVALLIKNLKQEPKSSQGNIVLTFYPLCLLFDYSLEAFSMQH